jgi:hypothetical protein
MPLVDRLEALAQDGRYDMTRIGGELSSDPYRFTGNT